MKTAVVRYLAGLLSALSGGAAMSAGESAAEQTKAEIISDQKKVFELPSTGTNLSREKGGWINVSISGTHVVVKFFDAEKKPISPDVSQGWARFRYASKSDMERTVLNREGDALVSPGNVRPPHNFLVTLSLSPGDDAAGSSLEPAEVYNFKFP